MYNMYWGFLSYKRFSNAFKLNLGMWLLVCGYPARVEALHPETGLSWLRLSSSLPLLMKIDATLLMQIQSPLGDWKDGLSPSVHLQQRSLQLRCCVPPLLASLLLLHSHVSSDWQSLCGHGFQMLLGILPLCYVHLTMCLRGSGPTRLEMHCLL